MRCGPGSLGGGTLAGVGCSQLWRGAGTGSRPRGGEGTRWAGSSAGGGGPGAAGSSPRVWLSALAAPRQCGARRPGCRPAPSLRPSPGPSAPAAARAPRPPPPLQWATCSAGSASASPPPWRTATPPGRRSRSRSPRSRGRAAARARGRSPGSPSSPRSQPAGGPAPAPRRTRTPRRRAPSRYARGRWWLRAGPGRPCPGRREEGRRRGEERAPSCPRAEGTGTWRLLVLGGQTPRCHPPPRGPGGLRWPGAPRRFLQIWGLIAATTRKSSRQKPTRMSVFVASAAQLGAAKVGWEEPV